MEGDATLRSELNAFAEMLPEGMQATRELAHYVTARLS